MHENLKSSMIDIHVHHNLPLIRYLWSAKQQNFSLNESENGLYPCLRVVSLYDFFGVVPFTYRFERLLQKIKDLQLQYPKQLITNSDSLKQCISQSKPSFIISLESSRFITSINQLDELYHHGLRLIQPLHILNNVWGHSSLEDMFPPSTKGLTYLGKQLVKHSHSLGLILDLAHTNRATASDMLEISSGTFIYSHTGYWRVKPSQRNINVWEAKEIARRGGIIGVSPYHVFLFENSYIKPSETDRWLRKYADTIIALVQDTNENTVVIGSDRGAPILLSKWFYSEQNMIKLGDFFQEAGLSSQFLAKFLYKNAFNFFERHFSHSGV